jgi:hypothetical protein
MRPFGGSLKIAASYQTKLSFNTHYHYHCFISTTIPIFTEGFPHLPQAKVIEPNRQSPICIPNFKLILGILMLDADYRQPPNQLWLPNLNQL